MGSPLVSCARGTRTIRMCSFDARSRRPIGPPATKRNKRAWKEGIGSGQVPFLLAERAR